MDKKIEITPATKDVLKNAWVMKTNNILSSEEEKLKEAITEVLCKTMTRQEYSRYWYDYYIEHKEYNEDLEYNREKLKGWANNLKEMGNANYNYAYALDRVNEEIDILNKMVNMMAEMIKNYDSDEKYRCFLDENIIEFVREEAEKYITI